MVRAVVFVVVLAACSRSHGVDDRDLGGLVIAAKSSNERIDVARAAKDVAELSRALALPHHTIVAALGPHSISIATTMSVDNVGQRVSELADRVSLELGDGGAFHAVYANSADYGRETIFAGGTLFMRPRYQRWHQRAPEAPEEPEQLRDQLCDAIASTWDLFGFAAEVTDRGTSQLAGRTAHTIGVTLAKQPPKPGREVVDQRKWRETRRVDALTGEIALDVDKGVPLAVKLDGTLEYERDGHQLSMHVTLDASLASIGRPASIIAPSGDEVVATPERLREVDDRDFLLQGIAPPSRKEAAK